MEWDGDLRIAVLSFSEFSVWARRPRRSNTNRLRRIARRDLADELVPQNFILQIDHDRGPAIEPDACVDLLDPDADRLDVHIRRDLEVYKWLNGLADVLLDPRHGRAAHRLGADDLRAPQKPQPATDRPTVPNFLGVEVSP